MQAHLWKYNGQLPFLKNAGFKSLDLFIWRILCFHTSIQ